MIESPFVSNLIELALTEDLSLGDVTSTACVPARSRSRAEVIAREPMVVCGMPVMDRIVLGARKYLSADISDPVLHVSEGLEVQAGTKMLALEGNTRALLGLERTLLNFLQRLCGVATYTRSVVSAAQRLTVLDTRKTVPGWRLLDKYAVAVGGGKNHRANLGDMVLVKNNHIDCQQGRSIEEKMRRALEKVGQSKGRYVPVEIEVRSIEELRIALEFDPEVVMLDNMSDQLITEAVELVRRSRASRGSARPLIEVSGGITTDRFAFLGSCGVDGVSLGALTSKAVCKDISMSIHGIE